MWVWTAFREDGRKGVGRRRNEGGRVEGKEEETRRKEGENEGEEKWKE